MFADICKGFLLGRCANKKECAKCRQNHLHIHFVAIVHLADYVGFSAISPDDDLGRRRRPFSFDSFQDQNITLSAKCSTGH